MDSCQSKDQNQASCDILILGSGFSGSLLAWILRRAGRRVALLDRGTHPRFAIGESSTPLADFLLERISDEYGLPELRPLARWGSWRATYPELRCGKKRGFSYFVHQEGVPYEASRDHDRSFIVSASSSDELSDTHWMRSDVDEWLCNQASKEGVSNQSNCRIDSIQRDSEGWKVHTDIHGRPSTVVAQWIVDATGAGGVVPRALHIEDVSSRLRTRTATLFAHVVGLKSMTDWRSRHDCPVSDDPFDGDDAAQHHLLQDGWVWMLRFASGITSVGIVKPVSFWPIAESGQLEPDFQNRERWWYETWGRYPTLAELMSNTEIVDPQFRGKPSLGWSPRISRLWAEAAGERWLALPSTVGVIDPLHSTGIAHSLYGVRAAAELLLCNDSFRQGQLLEDYRTRVVREIEWIDRIVSLCFDAMYDFELFTAVCSFYFLGAILCEREMSESGECQHGFLGVDRIAWQELLEEARRRLPRKESFARNGKQEFLRWLRTSIAPWNDVGLMEPSLKNRIARAAAPKGMPVGKGR